MRIFESGRAQVGGGELLYVVTEYAEESLSQVIPERPLSTAETREVLVPVLDALAYLHSRGMVHGHIKPTNIMAVDDRLKLPVETVRREGLSAAPRRDPHIYDAPEAASGTILPASDVWSLGVTLVEALTQHPPVWDRATRRDPEVPAEIPEPFAAIARSCLRFDAAKRATLAHIRRLLNPSSSLEEPANEIDQLAPAAISAHEPPPETSSRTRLLAIVAAVMVLLVVIVYALTRSHSSEPAPPSAQSPAPASAPAPAPTPSEQSPLRGAGTLKGEVAERVMPDITAAANRTIQGKVEVAVRVDVNASGEVENARIDSHGHSRYFTEKALDAARKWRFRPAQQDGRAVPSVWTLRFQFMRSGPEVHAVEVSP
jgi:TonB family protein